MTMSDRDGFVAIHESGAFGPTLVRLASEEIERLRGEQPVSGVPTFYGVGAAVQVWPLPASGWRVAEFRIIR